MKRVFALILAFTMAFGLTTGVANAHHGTMMTDAAKTGLQRQVTRAIHCLSNIAMTGEDGEYYMGHHSGWEHEHYTCAVEGCTIAGEHRHHGANGYYFGGFGGRHH